MKEMDELPYNRLDPENFGPFNLYLNEVFSVCGRQVDQCVNKCEKNQMNEFVNEYVEVESEIVNVPAEWLKRGVSDVDVTNEVYVSDKDMTYIEEDAYWSHDNESDQLSDFEEVANVIGEMHSDEDMNEIYVERGILGKPFERQPYGKINFVEGQLFLNVSHFREILKDFAIQEGFELYRLKNELSRVTCQCNVDGCTWRLHASPTPDKITYQIKSYRPRHTCIHSTQNFEATSAWIAKKLESLILADPNISYSIMKQALLDKYGIEPTYQMQLYRAKQRVHQTTKGIHSLSYNILPSWACVVIETNEGSVVKLAGSVVKWALEPRVGMNPQFKRVFACLDTMKKGFVKGCRPWFGIDGCHLKGPFGGILLYVVGLDGNKAMFPIALIVVEIENTDSWKFFLTLLRESLQSVPEWKDDFVTIMSDQQKGLCRAVAETFPYARHKLSSLIK